MGIIDVVLVIIFVAIIMIIIHRTIKLESKQNNSFNTFISKWN